MFSEWLAWSGAGVLALVTAYYIVFGQPSMDYARQKIFGVDNRIVGNKSARIPKKVLAYTFGGAGFFFLVAAVSYAYGY